MPLYEYQCAQCQASFEALRPMSDLDKPMACPICATTGARRKLSVFAAISRDGGSSRLVASSRESHGCSGCAGGSCATCGH